VRLASTSENKSPDDTNPPPFCSRSLFCGQSNVELDKLCGGTTCYKNAVLYREVGRRAEVWVYTRSVFPRTWLGIFHTLNDLHNCFRYEVSQIHLGVLLRANVYLWCAGPYYDLSPIGIMNVSISISRHKG